MPRWETLPALDDGTVRHTLDGRRSGAEVVVVPSARETVITIATLVAGIDEATVDRCKQRAERLLTEVLRDART